MAETGSSLQQATRELWRSELQENDRSMMQLVVGLAGMIVSIFIGYAYAGDTYLDGWQIWTWLLSVFISAGVLLSWDQRPFIHPTVQTLRRYWPLLALFIAGFLLRALYLETIPGGLHVDEMAFSDFALRHVFPPGSGQTISPFRTGWVSQPTMHSYILRLTLALGGHSISALRISSAIAGSLAILATYAVVAVFQNRTAALFAAALMTTYHYHVHWSRLSLNNIWDTVWVPLMLAAFAWGWQKNWSGAAVIAGLAAGLSQYFYLGSKVGLLLIVLLMIALYSHERDLRRLLVHGGKFWVTAVTVAAPIALFALLKPDIYFSRARVVAGWQESVILTAIGEYDLPRYLGYQLWRNFGAFTSVPDITGFYGPGIPFLIGLAAPLFVIGFFWAIWKRQWLPVAWVLLAVIFGGVLISGAPSSSHLVVVIPAICWLVAVPLEWLYQSGWRWPALLALAAIMVTDLVFYFGIYVPSGPRDLINDIPPPPDL